MCVYVSKKPVLNTTIKQTGYKSQQLAEALVPTISCFVTMPNEIGIVLHYSPSLKKILQIMCYLDVFYIFI